MNKRRWNWHLYAGFLLCLVGFGSYTFFFVKFPLTRDVPWANYLLLAAGLLLLFVGLTRAYRDSSHYRGKVAGPILGVLSVLLVGFFLYVIFGLTRQLPASANAPRVGQKAPEFVLADINNQQVSLATLLSSPLPGTGAAPKGVLLVFYRGYW
jgi:hypothetical protein